MDLEDILGAFIETEGLLENLTLFMLIMGWHNTFPFWQFPRYGSDHRYSMLTDIQI